MEPETTHATEALAHLRASTEGLGLLTELERLQKIGAVPDVAGLAKQFNLAEDAVRGALAALSVLELKGPPPAAIPFVPPPAMEAGTQIGAYTLQKELSRGGQGVVYSAWEARRGRQVVLKVLLGGRGEASAERFRRETRALSKLSHPSIVPVYESGTHANRQYMVLAFVAGGSLADRLDRSGPLAPREAAQLVATLAEAMDYAHYCSCLHRDLKPPNVLISESGEPLITDFGLVLDLEKAERDGRMTADGAGMGTPGYWAPEQMSGRREQEDARTDVYGLGGILYACLTGEPPIPYGGDAIAHMVAVYEVKPEDPRTISPAVDPALAEICLRCLEKDPADRFESARALADALSAYLGNRSRRPKVWIAGAVAVVALLGVLLGVALAPGNTPVRDSVEVDAPPTAVPDVDKALPELPSPTSLEFVVDGEKHLLANRYAEALAAVDQAIEHARSAPDTPSWRDYRVRALFTRSRALGHLDRWDDALAAIESALALDRSLALLLIWRGRVYIKLRQPELALADLERAQNMPPSALEKEIEPWIEEAKLQIQAAQVGQ